MQIRPSSASSAQLATSAPTPMTACGNCFSCKGLGGWDDVYHRKCFHSECDERCWACGTKKQLVIRRTCVNYSGNCPKTPMCHVCAGDDEIQMSECPACYESEEDQMDSDEEYPGDDIPFQVVQNFLDDGFAPSGGAWQARLSALRQHLQSRCELPAAGTDVPPDPETLQSALARLERGSFSILTDRAGRFPNCWADLRCEFNVADGDRGANSTLDCYSSAAVGLLFLKIERPATAEAQFETSVTAAQKMLRDAFRDSGEDLIYAEPFTKGSYPRGLGQEELEGYIGAAKAVLEAAEKASSTPPSKARRVA